jgi:hypothetical protein
MTDQVDIVVLSPDRAPLHAAVDAGLRAQRGVSLRVFRAIVPPRPGDRCRWETIARGRNAARRYGTSPWLMFLDDDVALGEDCIRRLLDELWHCPGYGAVAANYLGESRSGHPDRHIAMGATLFRRQVLRHIRFRWEDGHCECQCCCDDLRQLGFGIGYVAGARARHLARADTLCHPNSAGQDGEAPARRELGRVLAAFDRNHYSGFRRRFLVSFRSAGNTEWVTAVTYGLEPSETRALEAMERVEVVARPGGSLSPAVRRLRDFQDVLAPWDPQTPVAYWDAADVVFQGRLDPLWARVRQYPHQILAVREPLGHPGNSAVRNWTLSIAGRFARQEAFRLLATNPFLNAGFLAGTAGSLLRYLQYADRLRNTPPVNTTTDWGDQTVLNLYCHANPEVWQEVEESWNYCLCNRDLSETYRREDGRYVNRHHVPIHVVHGNAHTLSFPRRRVRT